MRKPQRNDPYSYRYHPRDRQPGDRLFEHTTTRRQPMRKRSYSKTYRPGDRGFGLAFAAIILWFTFWLSLVIGVVVVGIHFILKYW